MAEITFADGSKIVKVLVVIKGAQLINLLRSEVTILHYWKV